MRSDWLPEHHSSHDGLLDFSPQSSVRAQFDALLVPTNRPVESLSACIGLACETAIPLIVVCSKRIKKNQVIDAARGENVEVFAVDLPPHAVDLPPHLVNPLHGISFATSTDEDLLVLTSGLTRDLSTKRNLGLVIARMLGWQRLLFLDDDIYDVSKSDVEALASGLDDHTVSVLIPDEYPDNSVACHAHRLGGGPQGKFASGGSMGVRCDRDDLGFFPSIYNEDWFFFAEEAARHKITQVGASRQREYDPFEDPQRAVKEEFGDLLAEGVYARLDASRDISSADRAYWAGFKASRADFLSKVADSLEQHPDRNLNTKSGRSVRAAQVSIDAAQGQLTRIDPELCHKFIDLWLADLAKWRHYLTGLPRVESLADSLDKLGLDYAVSSPRIR